LKEIFQKEYLVTCRLLFRNISEIGILSINIIAIGIICRSKTIEVTKKGKLMTQWIDLFNFGYMFFWLIIAGVMVFIIGTVTWFKLSKST